MYIFYLFSYSQMHRYDRDILSISYRYRIEIEKLISKHHCMGHPV